MGRDRGRGSNRTKEKKIPLLFLLRFLLLPSFLLASLALSDSCKQRCEQLRSKYNNQQKKFKKIQINKEEKNSSADIFGWGSHPDPPVIQRPR